MLALRLRTRGLERRLASKRDSPLGVEAAAPHPERARPIPVHILTQPPLPTRMMYMHHDTGAPISAAACACTTLRKASRAITRMYDDALCDTGMSIVQFSILRNLARHGQLPLMQLADLLVMERTTLYRALTPLERQGWVLVAGGKGRAKTAVLTPRGRQALCAATGAWEGAQRKLLGAVGLKDWRTLEGSLARLVSLALEHET